MANVNNKIEIVDIKKKSSTVNSSYINQKPSSVSNNDIIDVNANTSFNNKIFSAFQSTKATIGVGIKKITAGLFDVLEFLGDGELRIINRLFEGQTYAISQAVGLVNSDGEQAILDFRKNVSDWIKEDIAVDIVNSFEDEFYNSKTGTAINDSSYMKKDSVAANNIEDGTRFIGEFALATAATVATAGIATVALAGGLGYASESGKKANQMYRNDINTTGAQEAQLAFSGVAGAAKWYAEGIVGESLLNVFKGLGKIFSLGPNKKQLGKAIWETFTIKKQKNPDKYVKAVKLGVRETANVVDVIGSAADSISNSLENNDTAVVTSTKVALGAVTNIVLNGTFDLVGFRTRQMRANPLSGSTVYNVAGNVRSIIRNGLQDFDAALDSGFIETRFIDDKIDDIADKVGSATNRILGKE